MILDEPLSFWGGFDAETGCIVDRHHAQYGKALTGSVLVMPGGRGSSSGSSVLAESLRKGTGPAAIVLTRPDPIALTGAVVAGELYGIVCPVVLMGTADASMLSNWQAARCEADSAIALLTPI